jgi:FdhE protein
LLSLLAEALGGAAVKGEGSLFMALGALRPGADDSTALLVDAINGDGAAIARVASRTAADAHAVHAVAGLLAMPFLHACRRRWEAHIPTDWNRGYCPLCGAWPAYAEIRGVERSRHLRCGRCASAWAMPHLSCAYCGTRDHEMLARLVAEGEASTWAVETCNACRGYLKVLTTLRGTAPESVAIEDLAGVELDLAAAARGYRRPDTRGYRLCVAADDVAQSVASGG